MGEVYAITGAEGVKPGFDVIARIMLAFDFLNPEWLILGKGKIVKSSHSGAYDPDLSASESLPEYITGSRLRILPVAVDEEGDERITMVPQKAAAGYLNRYHDPGFIEKLPAFNLPGLSVGTYRAFEVEGDSMQDQIQPGDWVIARYVDDWTQIRSMRLYVVVGNEGIGIVIKRVISTIRTDAQLILCSDNPLYPPYEVGIGEVRELWEVKRHLRSDPNRVV